MIWCSSRIFGCYQKSKNNLDGVIRVVFGEDVVRVLDRDNKLGVKGMVIRLLKEKIQHRRLECPLLAIFLNPKKLDKIVACRGVKDIVLVPWAAKEHAGYLKTHHDSKETFRSPKFDSPSAENDQD